MGELCQLWVKCNSELFLNIDIKRKYADGALSATCLGTFSEETVFSVFFRFDLV